MLGGFEGVAPGTGVVRIITRVGGFVTDDGVEHADLPVNAVADGSAQVLISIHICRSSNDGTHKS